MTAARVDEELNLGDGLFLLDPLDGGPVWLIHRPLRGLHPSTAVSGPETVVPLTVEQAENLQRALADRQALTPTVQTPAGPPAEPPMQRPGRPHLGLVR